MAATQAQRAALYAGLVDSMGEEAADTLMDQLPPSGWDQMATKDDLAAVELRLRAAFAAAIAETNAKIAESHTKLVESYAKLVESHADLKVAMHAGFADAARERAQAAKERAGIVKSQARQLYVMVATIAAATISIWIALFAVAASVTAG